MSKKSLLFRLHDLAERIHGVTDFLEKELEHPDPAPVNKYHPDSIFSKFKGCIKCGSTDYANGGSWDAYYNFICHNCGIKSLKKDPAPPLKARVAKLVGWEEPDELTVEWAIGAFWAYLEMNSLAGKIVRQDRRRKIIVVDYQTLIIRDIGELTAEDYCEAICSHYEGAKT